MRAIVDQNDLAHALGHLNRIVSAQIALPELAGVEITAVDERIVLKTTDLTSSLRMSVAAKVEEQGRAVAGSRMLTDLVNRLPTATVNLEAGEGKLVLRYGRNRASLNTYQEDALPQFPDFDGPVLTLPAGALAPLARQLNFAAARDEARGVLRGVLLKAGQGRLVFASSDGTRLSQTWVPVPDFLAEPTETVWPVKAVAEMSRLSAEAETTLRLGTKLASIQSGVSELTTRLLDGEYPDYHGAIPDNFVAVCRVSSADLRGALERLNIIVARDNASSVRVHLLPGDGLEISATQADVGSATEFIACASEGQDLTLLFNPHYLIDALRALEGDEVVWEFGGAQAPARFRELEESRFFHIVLPMRQLI